MLSVEHTSQGGPLFLMEIEIDVLAKILAGLFLLYNFLRDGCRLTPFDYVFTEVPHFWMSQHERHVLLNPKHYLVHETKNPMTYEGVYNEEL